MRTLHNWIVPTITAAAILDVGLMLAAGGSMNSDGTSDDFPQQIRSAGEAQVAAMEGVQFAQAINTPTPPLNAGPGSPASPGLPDRNAPGVPPTPPGYPHADIPPDRPWTPTTPPIIAETRPTTQASVESTNRPPSRGFSGHPAKPGIPGAPDAPGSPGMPNTVTPPNPTPNGTTGTPGAPAIPAVPNDPGPGAAPTTQPNPSGSGMPGR